jgi:hypothetical protein
VRFAGASTLSATLAAVIGAFAQSNAPITHEQRQQCSLIFT